MSRIEPWVVHERDCPLESWDQPERGSVRWRTLLSADRTPTDSLTLGVAELQPGQTEERLRTHRHAQPEVYYVLAGEGVVRVSGTDYPVRAGSAVFVPGNALHLVQNTGAGVLRLLYVFPASSFEQVHYEFPGIPPPEAPPR